MLNITIELQGSLQGLILDDCCGVLCMPSGIYGVKNLQNFLKYMYWHSGISMIRLVIINFPAFQTENFQCFLILTCEGRHVYIRFF